MSKYIFCVYEWMINVGSDRQNKERETLSIYTFKIKSSISKVFENSVALEKTACLSSILFFATLKVAKEICYLLNFINMHTLLIL